MKLQPDDAYAGIASLLGDDAVSVAIDVGAHVGESARRIVEVFPRSRVYAFEASARTYARLRESVAGEDRIEAMHLAVGSGPGRVEVRECSDSLFTSVLEPTENGHRLYGGAVADGGRSEVECVGLDGWARQGLADGGLGGVDLLKVDVQGFELEVLRGAERLLEGVRFLNCEAQLRAEYRGAATFAAIDSFLEERGFELFRVNELWSKGPERQSSVLDALWVCGAEMAAIREVASRRSETAWRRRARAALRGFSDGGAERIALLGAGYVGETLVSLCRVEGPRPVMLLDDDPAKQGREIGGLRVFSPDSDEARSVDAVLVATPTREYDGLKRVEHLQRLGIAVAVLYGDGTETAYPAHCGALA